MHDTLAVWEPLDVGFVSAHEGFDTTSALGRPLLNVLAPLTEWEWELIRERVVAKMERPGTHGKSPPAFQQSYSLRSVPHRPSA